MDFAIASALIAGLLTLVFGVTANAIKYRNYPLALNLMCAMWSCLAYVVIDAIIIIVTMVRK